MSWRIGSRGPSKYAPVARRSVEQARDEAEPEAELPQLVAERLRATLGGDALGAEALHQKSIRSPAVQSGAALRARGSNAGLAAASRRWVRYARGIGLVVAGVAIGFAWGRAPRWWPSDQALSANAVAASAGERVDVPRSLEGFAGAARAPEGSGHSVPQDSPVLAAPVSSHPSVARRESSSARRPPPAKTSAAADSLRFALEQLRKAQLFLRASDPKRALETLDVLDARVAVSVLQDEREVTRTLAFCDAGEVGKAAALARRFLEREPDSAYAASVRESCAEKAAFVERMQLEQIRERTSNAPH